MRSEATMAGNGGRLKGSQLGYHGKGVPDPETISELQKNYSSGSREIAARNPR